MHSIQPGLLKISENRNIERKLFLSLPIWHRLAVSTALPLLNETHLSPSSFHMRCDYRSANLLQFFIDMKRNLGWFRRFVLARFLIDKILMCTVRQYFTETEWNALEAKNLSSFQFVRCRCAEFKSYLQRTVVFMIFRVIFGIRSCLVRWLRLSRYIGATFSAILWLETAIIASICSLQVVPCTVFVKWR